MRARFGLAFGLTILSSAALAEPPADASTQSAILQAPRVPSSTLAGPKSPDLDTQPLADDRQAQGYGRRDLRDQSQNDEDDNDNDQGGRGWNGGRMGWQGHGQDHGQDMQAMQRMHMAHHGMMGGRMMGQRRPAFFVMRSGQNRLVVRCGPDESTKTCLDAIMPLLDKLQAMAPAGSATGAPSTSAPTPPSTTR